MKTVVWVAALSTLATAACQKAGGPVEPGSAHRGRYAGVGIYTPGEMWAQLARSAARSDPAVARLEDDEQVIVVVDTRTGEVRQCGNLSGHCLAMDPWSASASVQAAPAPLLKHAQDLAREAEGARRP